MTPGQREDRCCRLPFGRWPSATEGKSLGIDRPSFVWKIRTGFHWRVIPWAGLELRAAGWVSWRP